MHFYAIFAFRCSIVSQMSKNDAKGQFTGLFGVGRQRSSQVNGLCYMDHGLSNVFVVSMYNVVFFYIYVSPPQGFNRHSFKAHLGYD